MVRYEAERTALTRRGPQQVHHEFRLEFAAEGTPEVTEWGEPILQYPQCDDTKFLLSAVFITRESQAREQANIALVYGADPEGVRQWLERTLKYLRDKEEQ